MNPFELNQFSQRIAERIRNIPGHLTDREAKHLTLLTCLAKAEGEILEIGSFMGKSTVLLSKAAKKATNNPHIVAVDPLTQPSATDPNVTGNKPSRDFFYANLDKAGVEKDVEFHEMLSSDLAENWSRPIRMLWIDGDHTYDGVSSDFKYFSPHLATNGIIAIHDVMHGFRGPDKVFIENILQSDQFAAAGIVGSIGWAQKGNPTTQQRTQNATLAKKLQAWLNAFSNPSLPKNLNKIWLKIKRAQVPHSAVEAETLQPPLQ